MHADCGGSLGVRSDIDTHQINIQLAYTIYTYISNIWSDILITFKVSLWNTLLEQGLKFFFIYCI